MIVKIVILLNNNNSKLRFRQIQLYKPLKIKMLNFNNQISIIDTDVSPDSLDHLCFMSVNFGSCQNNGGLLASVNFNSRQHASTCTEL